MADSWLAPVEALPQRTFVLASAAAVAAPVLVAAALADPWWFALAIVPAAVAMALGTHRARVAALPLEVGPEALVGRVDGVKVFRFRARLGHGRAASRAVAHVVWRGEDGVDIPLSVEPAGYARVVGAWTVCARDRSGRTGAAGELHVVVKAEERGRTWQAEARWPATAIRRGRFGGPDVRDGRLVNVDWDAILPDDDPP